MTRKHAKPRARTRALTPIERAVLVDQWRKDKVSAALHVLIGGDGLRLVNGAGRIFYVVLGACVEHEIDPECTDLRILRGACNALAEQAENTAVDEMRRASIIAGLEACDRLMPLLSTRALGDSAGVMHRLLSARDVRFEDFEALTFVIQHQRKAA